MPKSYTEEFREDVVRVARDREPGVTLAQIAKDFDVHEITLHKWMQRTDADDGSRPGVTHAGCWSSTTSPAPCGCLPVAGEPAGQKLYSLVSEIAGDEILIGLFTDEGVALVGASVAG